MTEYDGTVIMSDTDYEYNYEATDYGWVLTARRKEPLNLDAFAAWNKFCETAGLDPKDRALRITLGQHGSWKDASEYTLNALTTHFEYLTRNYEFVLAYSQ